MSAAGWTAANPERVLLSVRARARARAAFLFPPREEMRLLRTGEAFQTHGMYSLSADSSDSIEIDCDGGRGLAGHVWGAGAALAALLLSPEGRRRFLADRPDVVELGSGTGVAGLAAAAAGASSVLLTDLPPAVPALAATATRNAHVLEGCHVAAAPLAWADASEVAHALAPSGCDLILAADVLYSPDAAEQEALRGAMLALAAPRGALVLHAYEERWDYVHEPWRRSLAGSGLRLQSEEELQVPTTGADGAPTLFSAPSELGSVERRRLVLELLRVDDGEEAPGG